MIKNKTISSLIISRDIRRMHMTKNIDSRLIEDKLIVNIRNSKNIKISELCSGICGETTLWRYENERSVPDSLTFYALMQRLGISPDRFDVILSGREEEYYKWREATLHAIRCKRWSELRKIIDNRVNIEMNNVLQEQYHTYLKAVLELRCNNNMVKFYEYSKKAIEYTVPTCEESIGICFLSSFELHLMCMYLYGARKNNIMPVKDIKNIFDKVEKYVCENIEDILEKSRVYPEIICAMLETVGDDINVNMRILYEQKAMSVLKDTLELANIIELLKWYVKDLHIVGKINEAKKTAIQLEALIDLMDRCGITYQEYRIEMWNIRDSQMRIFSEYVSAQREYRDLTQEQVSYKICAVETYSRIENGKQAVSRRNYTKLRERLCANWRMYEGQIVTNNPGMLLLMTKQRIAMINERYDEAYGLLEQLKKELNMEHIKNIQYVEMMKLILHSRDAHISPEKMIVEYRQLLRLTIDDKKVSKIKRYYTKTELEILYMIAMEYRKQNEYDKALEIVDAAINNVERHSLKHYNDTILMRVIRAKIYIDTHRYAESISESMEVIRMEIKIQQAEYIPQCVNLIGQALELEGKSDVTVYGQWYRIAIYMCDLLGYNKRSREYKEYYKQNIDHDIELY